MDPVKVVVNATALTGDYLRVTIVPHMARVKDGGRLLNRKHVDQSRFSAALFEYSRYPVLLPKALTRDKFDFYLMLASQSDNVISHLLSNRSCKACQVAGPKARVLHRDH